MVASAQGEDSSEQESSGTDTENTTQRQSSSTPGEEEETSSFDGEINSISDVTNAFKELQKNVSKLQTEDGEPIEITDFRELKKLMPNKIAGMKRTKNEGEKSGVMGFKISQAKAKYEAGDKRMEVEIVDFAGVAMIKAGLAAWSTLEVDRESDDGYERTFVDNGVNTHEKYNYKSKTGEINRIIDDRYLLSIKAYNVEQRDLEKAKDAINLNSLN